MEEVKIISVVEGTGLTPAGTPYRTRVVRYTVDRHGPFTVTLKEEEFTEARTKELMDAEVRSITQLIERIPEITVITEGTVISPVGVVEPTILIRYMVDDHGPFSEEVRKAEFDPYKMEVTLKGKVGEIRKLFYKEPFM